MRQSITLYYSAVLQEGLFHAVKYLYQVLGLPQNWELRNETCSLHRGMNLLCLCKI